jgi:tumor protein p53-inducible protein 3
MLSRSLGAAFTANYNTEDFASIVRDATGGRGVDVILDPVGASFFAKNVESAAVGARWVLFGLMGGAAVEGPVLASILQKRLRLEGTLLRSRALEYKVQLTQGVCSRRL